MEDIFFGTIDKCNKIPVIDRIYFAEWNVKLAIAIRYPIISKSS